MKGRYRTTVTALFFYRNVLSKEFGNVDGVVRAKRNPYMLVVLSRDEIKEVRKHLASPYDLVVKLFYGCGLCLFECQQLREPGRPLPCRESLNL
jgi:hypothetical protein